MLIPLNQAWLCPGIGEQAHVTSNAVCCECGCSNLASLAKILDRVEVVEQITGEIAYDGICSDLPAIQRMFEN